MSENENLRDLLSRLQSENVILKQQQQQQQQQQAPFTFSMPKNAGSGLELQTQGSFVDSSIFTPSIASSSRTATVLGSPASSDSPPKYTNPLEWSSLTSFDPSMLNVLDESPQTTATDGAMSMDFGFGTSSDALAGFPFTTIASNPAFFSLASTFDAVTPPQGDLSASSANTNHYNFDFGSLAPWPTSNHNIQDPTFNDLFNGNYMSCSSGDYNTFLANTPESAPLPRRMESNSSSSSSVSSASSPSDLLRTPKSDTDPHPKTECPKSKDACQKAIEAEGPSPFAPPTPPSNPSNLSAALKKTLDTNSTPIIACSGSKFPKTQQSDKNIEVLTAWRTITSNPKFKVRQRCLTLSLNSLLTRPTN